MYLLHTNHRRQGRIHAARSVGHANLGALVLTCMPAATAAASQSCKGASLTAAVLAAARAAH